MSDSQEALPTMKDLKPLLAPYQKANSSKAVWQLVGTLVPYIALWYLMYLSLQVSYWLTLVLAVPAAGLMVRLFIFFHDCGHNSFLPSTKANRRLGFWLGVLVFTPGEQWWHSHAIHHATSGNLDKRGVGDVETLTVEEYQNRSLVARIGYRLFRFPFIMFGLGPLYMFVISHRFPLPAYSKKETLSVVYTNLALAVMAAGLSFLFGGFWNYVLIQLPILWLAGMAGIWLFYVQHQFEGAYWARDAEWNYVASALLGASYYKLPKILQWFSGNIGFHHIHHLSPSIPNYSLEAAHENNPLVKKWTRVIPFGKGLRSLRLALINEKDGKQMVGFHDIM